MSAQTGTTSPPAIPIPVLLLKTKSTPNDSYEDYFSRDGRFAPQFVPVLSNTFNAANLQKLRRLLTEGNEGAYLRDGETRYGGMIFTSQRAVEAFAGVVREVALDRRTTNPLRALTLPLYVVGPATSRALHALTATSLPACDVLGAETGNGENLAAFVLDHFHSLHPPIVAGPNPSLLFLVGEQRRDVIPRTLSSSTLGPARRIGVDEWVVYESGLLASFAADLARVLERGVGEAEGEVGWVVVFSPTGCKELLGVLGVGREGKEVEGRKMRRVFVATIGPTTRDYLVREFGFEPDVCAERPSPEGVGEGMRIFMEGMGLLVG